MTALCVKTSKRVLVGQFTIAIHNTRFLATCLCLRAVLCVKTVTKHAEGFKNQLSKTRGVNNNPLTEMLIVHWLLGTRNIRSANKYSADP